MAEKFISDNGAKVHDRIRISTDAKIYEGFLLPRQNFTGEEMTVSFNSKYLTDIVSEVEDKNLKINLKDPISPVLIEDMSDKNSYYVVMPMKI